MTLQEYRKKQKKYHICRDCGNQDAFTLSGHTYCAYCAEKQAAAKREQRAKDGGKKNQEACKKWRDKNIAEHKCVYCGRPLKENYKYKTCEYCRATKKIGRKKAARRSDNLGYEVFFRVLFSMRQKSANRRWATMREVSREKN